MNPTTTDTPTTEVRRALSPLERWYWIADQVSPLNVIARVQVRGPLPPTLLRAALDWLRRRHPLLRVAIATAPDGRSPRFVPTDRPIPLHQVTHDEAGWVRRINEHELVDRIDWRRGPLCRTVVLTRASTGGVPDDEVHDLLLTMPHCVADGTTVLSLLRQWIDLAEQVRRGAGATDGADGAEPDEPGEPGEPALPGCEAMFPRRYRGLVGTLRLRWLLARDLYRVRRYRPARVVPSRFVPFTERRTRLLARTLTPEQVETLVAACRRERTTVHGALAAAMVLAVAAETGAPAPGHVTIGSPVTFRDALVPAVPERAVGAYVATVPTFVGYRPGLSLWQLARSISGDLAIRRRSGSHFAMVDLVTISCPRSVAASGRFIETMERTGPVNLCLSNIGRYDFPARVGPWQLSGAQFIAGLSVCGYFVSTVNTSHGRLFWNFTYVPDALPQERAARLVAASVDAVLAAIGCRSERSRA
ncbi:phthiocerol/phthiodiolone dimycocerosyl transferase family protein [Solwaraspora sp. WMMB335]|uniref:phthiocerol/phthiodiolone dimycocerosyl transferase family protein n=1 Tax=Solwaraspora sp. WMMB335 TaxID=3404118 RepID=UPI003B93D135